MPTKNKKIRRICFLNPQGFVSDPAPLGKTDTGGQTLYVLELAKALGQAGIKVDIVTRKFDKFPEEDQIAPNVKIIRIASEGNKYIRKEKLYEQMPMLIENFMHYIDKNKKEYDLIHSHYWDGGYSGLILAKMLDIPHVHTPHSLGKLKKIEMSAEKLPPQKLKSTYRYHVRIAIEQKIMNKADAIIVICETSRIQILQHYMVDFEKLHVIYPGVNTARFNKKRTAIDKKIQMKPNAILTVSRLAPAKGIDRVLEALSHLKGKVDFHYYMVANSSDTDLSQEEAVVDEQIRRLIKKYRLTKNVTRVGYLDHDTVLPAYYRGSEIFILASRYEPFGLTTLESMACGTLPLVSSVAGSKEIVVNRLNGFIVDMHDRKKLAKTIEELLKNRRLREKISDNALFTVEKNYSWDTIVKQIIDLYTSLV